MGVKPQPLGSQGPRAALVHGNAAAGKTPGSFPGLRFRGISRPAVFGAFGQMLIIGSDIEHLLFGDRIGHALRHRALPSHGRASALDHLSFR